MNTIRDAKKNKYKNILVCEDDVFYNDNFPINIEKQMILEYFTLGYYDYDKYK